METRAIKIVNITTPKALSCWNEPFDQRSKILTDAVRLLERADHRRGARRLSQRMAEPNTTLGSALGALRSA
jgi:hypothetical protein